MSALASSIGLTGARRIQLLASLKWAALLPVVLALKLVGVGFALFLVLLSSVLAFGALRAWERSRRRQFIRESRLPSFLATKLRHKYPKLSAGDADLVLRGLRHQLW